jgi:hypothetical protein
MIYPVNIRKYTGQIVERKLKEEFSYEARIKHEKCTVSKCFRDLGEAEAYLMQQNFELQLPIKNICYDRGDYFEMELTKGQYCKFDKADFDVIDGKCWHVSYHNGNGYAVTTIDRSTVKLHNYLLNHQPDEMTVDHINRDTLDNRRTNLRIVNKRDQAMNQKKREDNTSGNTGVSFKGKSWAANWVDDRGNRKSKTFAISKYGYEEAKNMAIAYRQQIITELPHYANRH